MTNHSDSYIIIRLEPKVRAKSDYPTHGRRDEKCLKSELRTVSPLIVRFADSSVLAPDPEFLQKFVRESTMRSLLYAVRRSLRRLERESIDLSLQ